MGDFWVENARKLGIARGFCISTGLEFGMNDGWHEHRNDAGGFGIRIRFQVFDAEPTVRGIFGDPKARVITLQPTLKKTACGCCGRVQMGWYDRKVRRVRDLSCGDTRIFLELEVRRLDCRSCGKVKRERLDFLADNPLYTKRFAYYVGRRCR